MAGVMFTHRAPPPSIFDDEVIGAQRLRAADGLLDAERVAFDALRQNDMVLVAEVEQDVSRLGVELLGSPGMAQDVCPLRVGLLLEHLDAAHAALAINYRHRHGVITGGEISLPALLAQGGGEFLK